MGGVAAIDGLVLDDLNLDDLAAPAEPRALVPTAPAGLTLSADPALTVAMIRKRIADFFGGLPDVQDLVKRAAAVEAFRDHQVTTDAERDQVIAEVQAVIGVRKDVEDFFTPWKERANAFHKTTCKVEKDTLGKAGEVERILRDRVTTYEADQRRKAAELERKLREEAQAQAEAEARRLEDERKAQGADLDAPIADDVTLDAIPETAPAPAPVAVAPIHVERPKASGASFSETPVAVVFDLAAFLRGVADGSIPPEAVTVNQGFLNTKAKALGVGLNYPGVKVEMKPTSRFSA